jgi:UDP-N-acetylmuramoyl-L-alanyl-D-glutamate--2,6-diaminopimelate ligase
MKLSQLLAALPEPATGGWPAGDADPEISDVVSDGRRAGPGSLFVARWHPGYAVDGHDFVAQAFARGAAAAVVQRPIEGLTGRRPRPGAGAPAADRPVVIVGSTALALGWLAAALRGFPARRLGLAGVTGTDGKTTTCALTTAILEAGGYRTGMVSTVASKVAGPARENLAHTSTPEAPEIQDLLAETVAGGGHRAVLECTSHALDQDRLSGCELDVAVVTRVTHEHLDYHGTYERYLGAKARLLDLLRPDERHPKPHPVPKAAVLNADDGSFAPLAERAPARVVRYAVRARSLLAGDAEVRALDLRDTGWGTAFRVVSPWGEGRLELPLPGTFNVYNALAALAAGCILGAPFEAALAALAAHRGVTGRMERVDLGQPFAVVVDFAHTPDALTQVLATLRPQTAGRLIAVFGSGGERDRQKRPWMGRIAAQQADYFVLTDEDPRLEDPEHILAEIAAGAQEAGAVEGRQFERLADRRRAIAAALGRARPGDTVLLAGKGHERSIIGATRGRLTTVAWDEREVARTALRDLGYG